MKGNSDWLFTANDNQLTDYTWSFGDGIVDVGPQVHHEYLSNGEFIVTLNVSDGNGCKSLFSVPVNVNSIGVEADLIQVFPNPTAEEIIIVADESLFGKNCWLTDLSGAVITQGKLAGVNTRIGLNDLAAGTYIIQVEGQSSRSKRIIKP